MAKTEEGVIKIEIEFRSSHEALICINGRRLKLNGMPFHGGSKWTTEGLEPMEGNRTLGGMIALKLHSPLTDILQAWLPDSMPDRPPQCWETLPDEVADEIEEKMNG